MGGLDQHVCMVLATEQNRICKGTRFQSDEILLTFIEDSTLTLVRALKIAKQHPGKGCTLWSTYRILMVASDLQNLCPRCCS